MRNEAVGRGGGHLPSQPATRLLARACPHSRQWFLAIHLPVPLVIAPRVFSGLGWQLVSFPVLVGAFFLGQFVGGLLTRLLGRG